jgi:hypothetical protein|tara:strand:- start:5310 stop:5516 length:207 start_codon:yes stop_codon:yes gene_type:complete
MTVQRSIIEALEKKYEAEISAADATIKIYLTQSVGIGEHPQHIEEVDKQLQKIADATEKMDELQNFKL